MMAKVKLRDYIEQIRGVSYKPNDVLDIIKDGYIPLLRANNIKDGKINFDKLVFVKEDKIKENQILRKGDILICTSSGSKELVGKAAIIRENKGIAFGAFCKVIRCKKILKNEFLGYYFQSNEYRKIITNSSNGANINNLRAEDFDNLELSIPDLDYQNRIVNKLDKVQEIIELRKKQIEELDKLIKSQFVGMFENQNFEKICIGDLVDKNITKLKKQYSNGESIRYIDISSINNIKNEITSNTEYVVGKEPSRAQQCVFKNDILISTVRPNLRNVAQIKSDEKNLIASSGFCVLRAKNCNVEYLRYIALSDKFTNDMVASTTGANYPAIRNSDIYNYEIYNPPIELQNQFAEMVKQIDKQKFEIQKSLEETQKLQESLMNKYFG